MARYMEQQLYELMKSFLSSAGNSTPRDLKSDLESIVSVYNANSTENR